MCIMSGSQSFSSILRVAVSCGGTGGVTSANLQGGTALSGLFGGGDSYHSAASGTSTSSAK